VYALKSIFLRKGLD